MEAVLQYFANGLMVGGIYALMALGVVVIVKATGVFNFAVGQMMGIGAFLFWTFSAPLGLPIWISLILALAGGALMGLIIERLGLRPLIGQPMIAPLLLTMALAFFLNGISVAIWGIYQQKLPDFLPSSPIRIGGIIFSQDLLWSFVIAMVLFVLLWAFYKYTRVGLAMRATAESHVVAQARGIKVRTIYSISWAICGIMVTVGGILLAYRVGVSQYLSLFGLKAFPAVLFGGMDSLPGAVVGGLIVGVLENLAGGLIASWMIEVTPYIILLIALIFLPDGLFGLKKIERI